MSLTVWQSLAKGASSCLVRNQRLLTMVEFLDKKENHIMLIDKKIYRVLNYGEGIEQVNDFINSIRCTDNFDCRNMSKQDAYKNSVCISGRIIDESIKECLIFTVLDAVNYGIEEEKFIELSFEELLEFCEEIESVQYVRDEA